MAYLLPIRYFHHKTAPIPSTESDLWLPMFGIISEA